MLAVARASAVMAVIMTGAVALGQMPSFAQSESGSTQGYEPAPKRSTARRNDAYRGTDNGPGLGTLGGQQAPAQPAPYMSGGDTPAYGAPARAGGYDQPSGPVTAQSGAYGTYEPRYGAPERPYAPEGATPGAAPGYGVPGNARPNASQQGRDDYSPAPPPAYAQSAPAGQGYGQPQGGYGQGPAPSQGYGQSPGYGQGPNQGQAQGGYGQPYSPPPRDEVRDRRPDDDYPGGGPRVDDRRDTSYSSNEILGAGHKFFGSISQGLASVVENAFKRQGRPNGYILGEEAGGAFIAGLRYGEGVLYTRDAGTHRVYWQGPSLGYDIGGAGSKTMILVYNLRSPDEIFERFGGIDGSAYFVGGVGMTVLTRDHITLAPIRTGVGLRLGANVGYLKFTPQATWNPF